MPAFFSDLELRECTNGYARDRRKGVGGFGAVFAGYNLREFNEVAVKRLERRGCSVEDWESKKRTCNRELAVSMRCDHPCLVKVVGIAKGKDYAIVYTPLARCSLMDAVDHEAVWPSADRVRACKDVVQALVALHEKRIVHGDVKMQNVLLAGGATDRGCILSDFGNSRVVRGNTVTLDHDDCAYPYWSPEYRDEGVLSFGMDMYGMGMLMLELYTWSFAFTDPSVTAARIEAFTRGDERGVRDMAAGAWEPALQARFAALAGRCLASNRTSRPTAAEYAVEVDAMLSGHKLDTPQKTTTKRKRDVQASS